MKLEMTNFRAIAANLVADGEVCDLAHADVSTQTETGTEIAPLIQQIWPAPGLDDTRLS
jgi:hypothetical protein